jgi:hypothetical protein
MICGWCGEYIVNSDQAVSIPGAGWVHRECSETADRFDEDFDNGYMGEWV